MDHSFAPLSVVLRRLLLFMLPAWLLLPLTFIIPPLNSTSAPYFDLTGGIGVAAYGMAEAGGKWGVPVLAVALLVVLLSRAGRSGKQRGIEALVLVLGFGVLLGGGVYLNEHAVKPALGVARPNIEQLAQTPTGAPSAHTALGRTAEAFYALGDKEARSIALKARSTDGGFRGVDLHPLVRDHWITETGFSFPSGHAFSAMGFAGFFLALGLSLLLGWRLRVFYLVIPWAVLVCYSRPILRVHSPLDITVGGLEGLGFGIVAFLVVRAALRRFGG